MAKNFRASSVSPSQAETDSPPTDIIIRLRRIEGQVRGVQRMIESDRSCGEILDQLSAIQEAVRKVSAAVAERYALECLEEAAKSKSPERNRDAAATLVDALLRAPH